MAAARHGYSVAITKFWGDFLMNWQQINWLPPLIYIVLSIDKQTRSIVNQGIKTKSLEKLAFKTVDNLGRKEIQIMISLQLYKLKVGHVSVFPSIHLSFNKFINTNLSSYLDNGGEVMLRQSLDSVCHEGMNTAP
jgi:hypothetical protein